MFPGRPAALERLVTHSQALIYPPGTKPEKYYGGSPLFRAKLISCSWVILSLRRRMYEGQVDFSPGTSK
jgi:hypothetical protein